jgi:osmotically-inducible protein OsmY
LDCGEAAKVRAPGKKEDAMGDKLLRQEIIDELDFDPSVHSAHIGVAVEDGVVTLTGHVSSYAEKVAAERAVQRVKGVRAIAEEIEIRYPNDSRTADDQIAKRALDIIAWDTTIPKDKIAVKVQEGWVSLSGDVDWNFQKTDAERAVRRLSGVVGISNAISIKPRVRADDVKIRIERALKRRAELDAGAIHVKAEGGRVTLEGKVKAWHERDLAERTAWAAPGVTAVEDRIRIE